MYVRPAKTDPRSEIFRSGLSHIDVCEKFKRFSIHGNRRLIQKETGVQQHDQSCYGADDQLPYLVISICTTLCLTLHTIPLIVSSSVTGQTKGRIIVI